MLIRTEVKFMCLIYDFYWNSMPYFTKMFHKTLETVKLQRNDNNSMYSSNMKNQNKQENTIQYETNKTIRQVCVEKY